MATEEPLTGGMVNAVVRVGDTVRRSAGPWTPTVHAVLHHLEQAGVSATELAEVLLDVQACDRDRTLTWGRAGRYPYDSFLERGFVAEIDAESSWLRDLVLPT